MTTKFYKKKYFILISILILTLCYPLISLLTFKRVALNSSSKHSGEQFQLKELNDNNNNHLRQDEDKFIQDKIPAAQEQPQDPIFREDVVNRNLQPVAAAPSSGTQSKLKIPHKLVHLDFKGAPPKLSYLTGLLPLFKKSGATGLLLEYEDMFPFSGSLSNISHTHHYGADELGAFLSLAKKKYDLEIIPLVQTFGHLEFVLKLEHNVRLREVPAYPQEVCPSNNEAKMLVLQLLDQIISFHTKLGLELKWVHIGADEVYHIGVCPKCRGKDGLTLFVAWVKMIAKEVKKKYGLKSIIWDDMLRKSAEPEELKKLGPYVDLMIWDYTESVDHLIPPYLWPVYTQAFPNIWVASAYKGAFGESLYKVKLTRHALNQMSWISTVQRESFQISSFQGFAITGWSRYDHFAILCELLPESIPSLVLSLEILKSQNLSAALRSTADSLKCTNILQPRINSGYSSSSELILSDFNTDYCTWNGTDLHNELSSLSFVQAGVKDLIRAWDDDGKGWLTRYNSKHNETSTWRLEEVKYELMTLKTSLKDTRDRLEIVLKNYYDDGTVREWLEQRLGWLEEDVTVLRKRVENLSKRKIWNRRG